MTAPPRLPPRALILTALDAVACMLRDESSYCADYIGGGLACARHRGDAELAAEFEAARRLVADGGELVILTSTGDRA